jgi:hypothetical protein
MSRGVYRGVRCALFDDPRFQQLSPSARHTLLTARLCLQAGPASIFRYYLDVLAAQTGLPPEKVQAALVELERAGWIELEGPVLWIRNGLRHDPNMRLADRKHRAAVVRAVDGLPRGPIVERFCHYYEIARAFEDPARVGSPRPIPSTDTETDLVEKGLDRLGAAGNGVTSATTSRQTALASSNADEPGPSPEQVAELVRGVVSKCTAATAAMTPAGVGRLRPAADELHARCLERVNGRRELARALGRREGEPPASAEETA